MGGVRHVLRRLTFGETPQLLAEVTDVNVAAWLDDQLHPERLDDAVCDAVVARWPTLGYSITAVRDAVDAGRLDYWDAMYDLGSAAIARAAWSRRQLLEVMVDVWSNLLQVTCPSSEVWDNRHRYDADVIRPNAFGTYADLLVAAITHPAMLTYLSNASSTKQHPNENLGRELLELHTVGVDVGYTERDVRNSALILTGLSVADHRREFRYRSEDHHVGPVQVMGFAHPNGSADGRPVVEAYLRHLAALPATARRVCRRLAVRFVADDPPAALIERLAGVYLTNGTAIRPVLTELFGSAEFAASAGAKERTPLESLVASMRMLGLQPPASGTGPLMEMYWMAESMGQPPYAWPAPNGYPDVAAAWRSASGALARWNMNSSLAGDWWPKGFTRPPITDFLPSPLPATYDGVLNAVSLRLRGRSADDVELRAIRGFLEVRGSGRPDPDDEALTWRLEQILALLLDSPTQLVR